MSATLSDINVVANDNDIQQRVAACVASRNLDNVDPMSWAIQHRWDIATYGEIADSYQYAEATKTINVNPRTGQRTDTILDTVLEEAVDSIIAAEAAASS